MKRFWAANRSRKGLVLYANTRNPAVRVWLAALILLAGLLCGCSGQGLGTKVVVKSLYFDWQEGAYQVALLYTTSGDSADAGEAEPEAKLLKGEGDTPLEALRQAEKATTQTVFYGQNELLLIGPGAADERLFEVCRFLAHDSTGRPNMAVFRVDVEADFWTGMEPESLYPLLQQLEQAAGRSVYTQYLYRIGAQDDTLLPSLTVSEQGEKVLAGPLVLYRQGIPSAVWRAETANLAAAAAGQASTLEFELQLERGLVHFTVDAPSLYYRVQDRKSVV